MESSQVLHGDCIEVLKQFPDNHFTACVTDPPYGLSAQPDMAEVLTHWLTGDDYSHRGSGFMQAAWDSFVPGPATWREVYRVLKPGATLLCFAGQRTQDLMGVSLRLAGFEVTDTIMWVFGVGFPKSHNVSRAIDKAAIVNCPDCVGAIGYYQMEKRLWRKAMLWLMVQKPAMRLRKYLKRRKIDSCGRCKGSGKVKGAEREVMGQGQWSGRQPNKRDNHNSLYGDYAASNHVATQITAPATPEAALFAGWASALKPAYEPILVCRKSNDGSFAQNALRRGVSGLNIDGCRVEVSKDDSSHRKPQDKYYCNDSIFGVGGGQNQKNGNLNPQGRFPPNLLLECNCGAGQGGKHAPDCVCGMLDEQSGVSVSSGTVVANKPGAAPNGIYGNYGINLQSKNVGKGDKGGASRFYPNLPPDAARFKYSPKAPQKERGDYGHPTQKPEAVMDWLCRLVKQPEYNLLLDPFGGTGTTAIGAIKNRMGYVVIEQEPEYVEAIKHRIATYTGQPEPPVKAKLNGKPPEPKQMSLF